MAITIINKLNNDSGEHWKHCSPRCGYRSVQNPETVGIKLPDGRFFCLRHREAAKQHAVWSPGEDTIWVEVNLDIEVYDA